MYENEPFIIALTQEQIDKLEVEIREKWNDFFDDKMVYDIIANVFFYKWDKTPRWFVTLIDERFVMKKIMKIENYEAKERGLEVVRHPNEQKSIEGAGYFEVDIYPYLDGDKIHIDKMESPGHGWPCASVELYNDEERYKGEVDIDKLMTIPIEEEV